MRIDIFFPDFTENENEMKCGADSNFGKTMIDSRVYYLLR